MKTTQSKDGTIIAYDVYGSGPALIVITGASCFRSFMPVVNDAKTFAREFTVYNYDRRGRGDSGNTLPYALEREIEDIESLIDSAGGTAMLYGHSSGAVLALEAAMRLGNKVSKVVIYDAAYVHDDAEKTEYGQLGQEVDGLLKKDKNGKAMTHFLQGIGMPKAFVYLMPLMPGWRTMKALAPTLLYDIALTRDLPPLARIAKITVPTHIVVGQKSPAGLHDVAAQLARTIRHASSTTLVGQDHMPKASAVLQVLTNFWKGTPNAR